MTDEHFYVRVGKGRKKQARDSIGMVSDLRNFINLHFNFPLPQVTLNEDGCVIITGLFDGIPDDEENQEHERFDHMLELFGWIEGRTELPMSSNSVAPKVLEEMPIDEKHILEKESSTPFAHLVLDESPRCVLLSDDDRSTMEKLEIDSSLQNIEELAQIEAKADSILIKESSDVVAHKVFGEMLESQQELKQANLRILEVTNLKNASLLLLIRSESTELINSLNVLSTQERISACYTGILCYDPGGGFWYPALVDETLLPNSETLHQLAIDFASVSDQGDPKVLDMNDVKDAKLLLLAKSELTGLMKMLNKLTTQGRMMNGSAESLIFDPGGKKVACDLLAEISLLRLKSLTDARENGEMVFDPGGQN